MRKTLAILSCAVLLFPFLAFFSACKSAGAKDEYQIVAEYFPEEGRLQAEMTVCAVNTTDNVLSELKFGLYPNVYREGAKNKPVSPLFESACFYDGESYGGIQIDALTGGEWRVCGEDENILAVSLAKPLYPDERAVVSLSFTLTLSKNNHRLGIGEHAVNLTHFYPVLCHRTDSGFAEYPFTACGDPFVSDCADYTVSMTVPEEYTLVYGGAGSSVTQNGKATYNIVAKDVRDVAFVLGKEFKRESMQAGGVQVEYYYMQDEDAQSTLSAAASALAFFSETFTPYEEERYTVAETDFLFGGMEYSALALISNGLHKSERLDAVIHETAHQWWYYKVGSNQAEESWQDEGLSEYSVALFYGAHPEYGKTYRDRVALAEKSYRSYFSVYSQLGGADTRMSRPLNTFKGEYEYRSIAYDKGVVLFDKLREGAGERKFFSALKKYAARFDKKQATRADLVACFEDVGAHTEGLFSSFLDGLCVI